MLLWLIPLILSAASSCTVPALRHAVVVGSAENTKIKNQVESSIVTAYSQLRSLFQSANFKTATFKRRFEQTVYASLEPLFDTKLISIGQNLDVKERVLAIPNAFRNARLKKTADSVSALLSLIYPEGSLLADEKVKAVIVVNLLPVFQLRYESLFKQSRASLHVLFRILRLCNAKPSGLVPKGFQVRVDAEVIAENFNRFLYALFAGKDRSLDILKVLREECKVETLF